MSQLRPDDSIALIESPGFLAAARLAQAIASESRARVIGVSPVNPAGVITTLIAGSVAEVQQALQVAKSQESVTDSQFFARPDLGTLELLLSSIMSPQQPRTALQPSRVEHVAPISPDAGHDRDNFSHQRPAKQPSKASSADPFVRRTLLELDAFNVHQLRRYARSIPGFPIMGRAISMANRSELLQMIKSHEEGVQTLAASQTRQPIKGIQPN